MVLIGLYVNRRAAMKPDEKSKSAIFKDKNNTKCKNLLAWIVFSFIWMVGKMGYFKWEMYIL